MTSKLDGLRVLLIEDDALIAEQMQLFLEDAAMIVAGVFSDLPNALAAAESDEFGLGLVDVNLGGEDSYPVVDKLVERGIPFILMTGYAPGQLPAKYAAYPSLTKPFEPQALLDLIAQVV